MNARPDSGTSRAGPINHGGPAELGSLIAATAAQDQKAFSVLFRAFAPLIKSYLLRRGFDKNQAEELTQEAMLLVWRKARLFDPGAGSAQGWLFTIVRNVSIDFVRRQARPDDLLDDETLRVPRPDEILEAKESGELVKRALTNLAPDQVEAIRLSFFDGHPHSIIVSVLGVPLGTVKSRIRQGLQKLRKMLVE